MTLSGVYAYQCYMGMFNQCNYLSTGYIRILATEGTSNAQCMNNFMYTNDSNRNHQVLDYFEVCFTSWSNGSNFTGYWFGSNYRGHPKYFIKPSSLPINRGPSAIPYGSIVLNRIDGVLYYAEDAEGHTSGDLFTGPDPANK